MCQLTIKLNETRLDILDASLVWVQGIWGVQHLKGGMIKVNEVFQNVLLLIFEL